MPTGPPARSGFGLPARELRREERVLHHWRARAGRGLLTSHRLLLLGHPAPIHRPILWSVDLENVTNIEVIEASFPQAFRVQTQVIGGNYPAALGSGHAEPVNYDALFVVLANGVPLFSGDPGKAEQIQRWIDESRVARMLAVYGRVHPPTGGPPRTPPPFRTISEGG